jgi:hypothetical protein
MAIAINGSSNTITGIAVGGLPDGIVDTDMLAANAVTSGKLASGAVGKWTHVNYASIGTSGSYTFSGIPTDTSALRITFLNLSSDTGSNGSESYAGLRLGTASGLLTSYNAIVAYLETSYQRVDAWTSRHLLYNDNYGRAANTFNGQIHCWKTPGTDRWNIMSDVTRGINSTYFWTQSYGNLGANITQAQLFLNTGSFDGGSASISYYQD